MTNTLRAVRFHFAFLALCLTSVSGLRAETLAAAQDGAYTDVCGAIAAAMPGDIVEVFPGARSGQCTVTTPHLTIKGVGTRPSASGDGEFTGWTVAADDTQIENLTFDGSRCAAGSCTAIELLSGSLTLRNVSITGSKVGVKARGAEVNALSIVRCEIASNGINIDVGNIHQFHLQSSYIHDAKGGALVTTAAGENILQGNRLASGSERTASGEVVIAGSAKTLLSGNLLLRASTGSTAGLVQYVAGAGEPGEVVAQRNTFVNAAISGIDFIEAVGDRAPVVRLDGNVLWGDAPARTLTDANTASSNYLGVDRVFGGDSDFRLNGDYVRPNTGASVTDEAAFPLNVGTAAIQQTSRKVRTLAAVGDATPSSITLTSTQVGGSGYVFSNKVFLSGPAPTGGVVVTFTSSNTSVVTMVNSSITISAGQTSGIFAFKTIVPSTLTPVTITAAANGGEASAVVNVGPVSIANVTLGATQIGSNGTITTNRVELTGPAPTTMVITLSSSSSSVTPSATVTIPAGITSNSFTLTAGQVDAATSAVITATHSTGSKSNSIVVLPVGVSSMLLTPTSTSGGVNVLVKVYLNGPAPAEGLNVDLTSSNPGVLPLPPTITAPAGATDVSVVVKPNWVSANTSVNVTAQTEFGTATRSMTVIPTQVAAVQSSSTKVTSGGSATVTVTLTGPAPSGGTIVSLSSSAPAQLSIPSSVLVPAGANQASVVAQAAAVVSSSTSVTVRGTGGGVTKTVAITVAP